MKRVAFIGAVVAVLALALAFAYSRSDTAASGIVARCGGLGENDKLTCYNREIPQLLPERSLAETFDIVREIRRMDPGYQFCHVVGHKLGEQTVAEDPSRWFEFLSLNPRDGLCSNGFIHGVIVGRFRNDVLDDATITKSIPDFARACAPREDWRASPLDQAICYHGLGHLFVFITSADIRRSLDTCAAMEQSSDDAFMKLCREGVFMQIYQPMEPDDFALVDLLPEKPTRENYRRLCAAYALDEEEGACLREAWPLFRDEILAGNGAAFCAGEPSAREEDFCFESASTIIGRQLLGNDARVASACGGLPSARQDGCFIAAAQAFLEEDRTAGKKAAALCENAPDPGVCFTALASRAAWIYGDDARSMRTLCAALPREHRAACPVR